MSSKRERRRQHRLEQLTNGTVICSSCCGEELSVNQVQRGQNPSGYRKRQQKSIKPFPKSPQQSSLHQGCREGRDNWLPLRSRKGGATPAKCDRARRSLPSPGQPPPLTEPNEAEGNSLLDQPRPLARCNHYWFRSRQDCAARATEPWRQAPLDDMMDFHDDADRGVYRRVNDTLLRDRCGTELARRVRALATYEGECQPHPPTRPARRPQTRPSDPSVCCSLPAGTARKPGAAVSCSNHAMLTRDGVGSGPTPHRTSA